jgi:hypothetical protein
MNARTVIATFYGINIKMHNDPYVALAEGPQLELVKAVAGVPGLVVRLSVCSYHHLLLSVPYLS